MSLRNLIGEEQWKQLSKKFAHMDALLYLVVCETCDQIFYETKLSTVQDMLLRGEWDPYQPQLWFVTAGRHWLKAKFHSIRVYVHDGHGDKVLVKDLSSEWTAGQKAHGYTDAALANELNDLEKSILAKQNLR